ncbi:hypothetical protein [Myceligenerans crystallogenes]
MSDMPDVAQGTTGLDEHRAHLPGNLGQIVESLFAIEAWVSADHATPLANRLGAMGIDIPRLWSAPRWNMGVRKASRRRHIDDADPRLRKAEDHLLTVVGHPAGPVLLGLYLWSITNDASQQSGRHGRVLAPVSGFTRAWERHRDKVPCGHCRVEGDAAVALSHCLMARLEVAGARNSGSIARFTGKVSGAIDAAERLLDAAGRIADDGPLRKAFTNQARWRIRYFTALHDAATATAATLAGDASGLAAAIETLHDVERTGGLNYILASELRAHRTHLEALCAGAGADWLVLDRCRTVYVFPFGLPQVDGKAATATIRELIHHPLPYLLGARAASVRTALKLDDVWDTEDPFGSFDGATLNLPDVEISHQDGTLVAHLSCEVRFGDLGNHYVRFRQTGRELGPQQVRDTRYLMSSLHDDLVLNWVIPRPDGSIEHVPIVTGTGYHPVHLFHLAYRLQEAIAAHFTRSVADWHDENAPAIRSEQKLKHYLARGRSHVLTFVYEASAGPAAAPRDRRRPVASADELLATYGHQPLLQPVPFHTSSLVDWTLPQRSPHVLQGVRNIGDLVAVTPNATTVALFGSAHFKIVQYGSLLEFVAGLSGMLAAWNTRLAEYVSDIEAMLRQQEDPADDLAHRVEHLREQQLQLHEFGARARRALSVVSSPTMLASATEFQQLAELMQAFDVTRQASELNRRMRELLAERVEARLTTIQRQHEEHESAEQRRILEGLTVAVSTFAVLTVIHTILAIGVEAGLWDGWPPAVFAVASSVVAFVMAVLVFRFWVRRTRGGHEPPALRLYVASGGSTTPR